ncbi:ribonuclease P protein component [Seinonella peptonophila]|uniref:Ribonuclease P protein component n=1 Tax=Seinonella peptonophila TaxID=112248 RepID=A0A1M4WZG9_9BACL|nr:ribonuclease P protein component [Seinonella peptonophila]SHE86527.1 ribonuclease P protein component [Seinonella peptonophila]
MHRTYRLKARRDFRRVFRLGRSVANRQFVVFLRYRRPGEHDSFRLGISVSRKVGKAVVRNRIRRRVKEVVRSWANELKHDVDLIIIVRKPAVDLTFQQVESSLRHVMKKAKCFRSRSPE